MAITNAVRRHGSFIYLATSTITRYGSADNVADLMLRLGMSHAWVRLHNQTTPENKPATRSLINALRAKNINVAGWGWCEGADIQSEITLTTSLLTEYGLGTFVADIEHELKVRRNGRDVRIDWTVDEVKTYLTAVRRHVGDAGCLLVSTYGLITEHSASIPLMKAAQPIVDGFAPQTYWFTHPKRSHITNAGLDPTKYELNDASSYVRLCVDACRKVGLSKPIVATGQAYWSQGESPSFRQPQAEAKVVEFLDGFSRWRSLAGFNWWHLGHPNPTLAEGTMSPNMQSAIDAANVGEKTFAEIEGQPAPTPLASFAAAAEASATADIDTYIIRPGMTGGDIYRLQKFLLSRDPNALPGHGADSSFGAETSNAVLSYQTTEHLSPPTGYFDLRTIGHAVAQGYQPVIWDKNAGRTPSWPPKPTKLRRTTRPEILTDYEEFDFAPIAPGVRDIRILGDWVQRNIVSITVPQLIGTNGLAKRTGEVKCHRLVADKISQVFNAWDEAGLVNRAITYEGCFVPRFQAGYDPNGDNVLSFHSWGIAFDINYQWNQLDQVPALVGDRGSVRELVAIANKLGFWWGGHFGSPKDGMHFEIGRKT